MTTFSRALFDCLVRGSVYELHMGTVHHIQHARFQEYLPDGTLLFVLEKGTKAHVNPNLIHAAFEQGREL